ncbi:hypothetical protein CYLTODRAFT_345979 [Cylindrobasidium torrendii FP15055 ss-10]|uniref:Uncharacterized protein n=1 Tax=Cylindrobasidium torrendii FP15055 ss-10 TaxID=1314674 RepID=A0A0D7BPC2_9AGAR|nr:hypothetical protein CYLTODRAFT_345979 [Cylindrobasidium torrendii FP15055 ss-10]
MTISRGRLDQSTLRYCLSLSSSHLIADPTTSSASNEGVRKWLIGFNRLVDVLLVLHDRDELEVETLNAASRACSECWSVAGTWHGLEEGREGVRLVAAKLQGLLDPNQKTYKGQAIYTP